MLKKNKPPKPQYRRAQTAMEYMLLLAVVVTVTIIGFYRLGPRTQYAANLYYQRAAAGIVGTSAPQASAPAVDGEWCNWGPCQGCGTSIQTRTCSCPSPSNGGATCFGIASQPCQGPPATDTWRIACRQNPGVPGHCHDAIECGSFNAGNCCDPGQRPDDSSLRLDVPCSCPFPSFCSCH